MGSTFQGRDSICEIPGALPPAIKFHAYSVGLLTDLGRFVVFVFNSVSNIRKQWSAS